MGVALALAALVALEAIVFANALRFQDRAHQRDRRTWDAERRELLDRLCHLAGRTWTLPPRPAEPEPEPDPYEDVDQLP